MNEQQGFFVALVKLLFPIALCLSAAVFAAAGQPQPKEPWGPFKSLLFTLTIQQEGSAAKLEMANQK